MDNQKFLAELRGQLETSEKEINAIKDLCVKENRSRNEDEKAKWAELKAKISGLEEEIRDMEEQIAKDVAAAKAKGSYVAPASHETPGKEDLGKNEIKNIRKFSFVKATRSSNPKTGVKLDGVEAELQQEAIKELRATKNEHIEGATLVPYVALRYMDWGVEKRDVVAGTANLGAELINTSTSGDNYIAALRTQNVLMNAGVEFIPNTDGSNVNMPRENSLYVAAMAATENAAATESMTATLFTTVPFSPKRGTGFVQLSNQLSAQAPWFEQRLRKQILKGNATLMDLQGISGTGASGQARGILNTSGTGSVVGGTNGANFARTHIVQFEQQVGSAGGNLGNSRFITNFAINRFGKQTETSTGSGRFLVDYAATIYGALNPSTGRNAVSMIDQYPAHLSANVPNNLVKGSSGAVCSAVIFGDVSQAAYMQFGGLQIIVDPYSSGQSALTNYYVHFWYDFNVLLPGAWATSVDMLTP